MRFASIRVYSRPKASRRQAEQGFALLFIFVLMAGIAVAMLMQLPRVAFETQREREELLIERGEQYQRAIGLYVKQMKRYPQKLEDLLKDSRVPVTLRHLRRIYRDPITGGAQWGVVEAPEGGIMGVYSLSEEPPVKTGGFSKANQAFDGAEKYSDWKFTYAPAVPASPNGLPASR